MRKYLGFGLVVLVLVLSASALRAQPCNDPFIVPEGEWIILGENVECECAVIDGWLSTGSYTLTVTGAGGLDVSSTGKVFVDGAGGAIALTGGGTHTMDGEIHLLPWTRLRIQADTVLLGAGFVRGYGSGAAISIQGARTLTNRLATGIIGSLRIETNVVAGLAPAVFANEGVVMADGGVIELATNLTVRDTAGADRWLTSIKLGSELTFGSEATDLVGDFVNSGTLTFSQSVTTCGRWTFNCGALVKIAADKTFQYADYSGTCPNPGSGSGGCDTPFELRSGVYTCSCP